MVVFNPLHESTNQGPLFIAHYRTGEKIQTNNVFFEKLPPWSFHCKKVGRPVPQHAVPFQGSCCALGLAKNMKKITHGKTSESGKLVGG